ncbi:MAG TPA: acyltransferase family protein [Anaeromyxobacteraceae bacterium]
MSSPRQLWLDAERGLAVFFMVEVHTLDAWLAPGPGTPLRDALLMLGGFAAPSFLFMAGLSQVLGDAAMARRGLRPPERRRRALRRAARLLAIAFAFRAGEYLLGGRFRVAGGWQDLLRVDILNVMAVALAASALLVVGRSGRWQIPLAIAVAVGLVAVTPVVAAWDHPPSRILDYLQASYPRANFSLCNWAGFLFAGAAVGALATSRERPALLLAAAAALVLGGVLGDALPPIYAHQDYWHTSPAWFAVRLGGVLALTALLQRAPPAAIPEGLRTLGRHSLLGYVASVELTYGLASWPLHRALPLGGVLAGIAAMTAVAWALAVAADRLAARRGAQPPASRPSTA